MGRLQRRDLQLPRLREPLEAAVTGSAPVRHRGPRPAYEQFGLEVCIGCAGCSRSRSGTHARRRCSSPAIARHQAPVLTRNHQELVFASETQSDPAPRGCVRESSIRQSLDRVPRATDTSPRRGRIFGGVRKLPPATLQLTCEARLRPAAVLATAGRPPRTRADQKPTRGAARLLREALRDAVRSHLMSDVPLGAFLSGGIDSSTIVALMAEVSSQPVRTFSIGFDDSEHDELDKARIVASRFERIITSSSSSPPQSTSCRRSSSTLPSRSPTPPRFRPTSSPGSPQTPSRSRCPATVVTSSSSGIRRSRGSSSRGRSNLCRRS